MIPLLIMGHGQSFAFCIFAYFVYTLIYVYIVLTPYFQRTKTEFFSWVGNFRPETHHSFPFHLNTIKRTNEHSFFLFLYFWRRWLKFNLRKNVTASVCCVWCVQNELTIDLMIYQRGDRSTSDFNRFDVY